MAKKIDKEKENKIIELSKQNLTQSEIARIMNVTHKVVKRVGLENNLIFAKPTNAKTDKKTENRIISLYDEGYNTPDISKFTNVSIVTINRILTRNGYTDRSKHDKRILSITRELEKEICDLYKKGFSTVDISNMFKDKIKCDHTVSNILKKNNVEVGKAGCNAIIENPKFFNIIDTEAKAYFLGFITADGNVHIDKRNKHIFQIMLQDRDAYILETLRDLLGSKVKDKDFENKTVNLIPKPLHYDKNKNETSFFVISKDIFNDLNKHGIVENKTFKTYFPNTIPNHLIRHYIRGYFDGDGCVTFTNNSLKVIFYGQHNYIESIKNILISELNLNNNKIFDKETVSMITWSRKKDIASLFNYLYKDANYYLIRKKEKFIAHIDTEVTGI